MEKSIFTFIWKHSKRDQIILLLVTLLTFPILYVSLELPKRIINDAISGSSESVQILGITLTQVQFLLLLCTGFLLAVLVNGLLKMRLNTMKGVLAERLLRRFRYQLLTRILRFPKPYFRNTSQGELVSMVTSEAEPLGGIMGDMLSQPILQAGQMITILIFLFAQSVWFGLAAIALIPLQAWIIPILQRKINLLNKERIQEVRRLAADIGETAAGVSDIRTNGGLRYRMSLFSSRLGNLYDIRFEIYQKKFFMKFLNNFINQLTPFFFYSVGGYLAIMGHITVGALVAALAAFKDMSSPWKELLTFYNTTQDVALRWEVVTERFATSALVDDSLFEGSPDGPVNLKGAIEILDVTVRDEDGQIILEDISLTIPQGARVAIKTDNENAGLAFADLLTREVLPQRGSVRVAGRELNSVHQETLSNCIGYAHSNPHILQGTLGENVLMPFKTRPVDEKNIDPDISGFQHKAAQSGNSTDVLDADWINPAIAGLQSSEDIRDWWFELVQAMGIDDFMVRRALRSRIDQHGHQQLTDAIVRLRPEIAQRLVDEGLDEIVHRFHPDKFNPVSPLGSNLLYALPTRMLTQESLAQEANFVAMLREQGIADELMQMSVDLIENMTATFGSDGTDHPLFRRLNMEEELYQRLSAIIINRRNSGDDALPAEDYALILTVPFAFSSEQMGPAFSDQFKERILQIRKARAAQMIQGLNGLFETLNPDKYIPAMTVLGNALFGRIFSVAGAREKMIEDIIVDVFSKHNLRRLAAESIYDLVTSSGGENIPAVFRERIAFSRAGIKKPDILILANSLASHDSEARDQMRERISRLMPDTTKIFIEKNIINPEKYDLFIEIVNGRIDGGAEQDAVEDTDARQDLNRKIAEIAKTELFSVLDRKQQRLLAFGSQWYKAKPGQTIFSVNEEADAAYLCIKGSAGLLWQTDEGHKRLISDILPGRLIGDLSIILKTPRTLDLVAKDECLFLRIGASELMAVIENDGMIASSLLRSVAGHLTSSIEKTRSMRAYSTERGVDFSEFDTDR
ncbi:MAG: ABC transporter transmembrane domain-containing protein [Granulosicoccus sp.]